MNDLMFTKRKEGQCRTCWMHKNQCYRTKDGGLIFRPPLLCNNNDDCLCVNHLRVYQFIHDAGCKIKLKES